MCNQSTLSNTHYLPSGYLSLDRDSAPHHGGMLISDVVRLSGTYLILLIRIRLYLCRLDYILSMFLLYLPFRMFLLSSFGTPYCSSFIVLFRDIPFVPQWTIVLYHNRRSRLSL